ncbi:hypothetical protein PXH69_29095 [Rhodococcus qingshengii]|uniref:Restriction endonuclease n=1 Tax=Rhodococcus qingshengii TaxID=334542 RepID=A0AAW6LUB5_RHOSG|nr:hypothetical protein [Rhodococcus qingshengii]MDE8649036.1 hypothetical protein [Rhodococcus qingshengii]
MDDRVKLDPWFVHDRLIVGLLTDLEKAAVEHSLGPANSSLAAVYKSTALSDAVAKYVVTRKVPSGAREYVAGTLHKGQLVWFDQKFHFKGVAAAHGKGLTRGAFLHTKLDVDESVRVHGEFNPQRVTSGSSLVQLKGHQQQFVFAHVSDIDEGGIEIRPILLGHMIRPDGIFDEYVCNRVSVHPSRIDQFKDVKFAVPGASPKDLEPLRTVPEEQVKRWFAEILHEPVVPKDWGGEQFDLWTDKMTIDGENQVAAIQFKGPAKFSRMTIKTLGANGDQIDRLAQTDADLLVVQHCHEITAPVSNMLRAVVSQPGRQRRYMIIDGYKTLAILRHYGYLTKR